MIVATILEVEGSGFPQHQHNLYSGKGCHARSVKKAMEAARLDLRRSFRAGGSRGEYLDGMQWGTPVYSQVRIMKNGKVIHFQCD